MNLQDSFEEEHLPNFLNQRRINQVNEVSVSMVDITIWMGWSDKDGGCALTIISAENEEMRREDSGIYRKSARKTKQRFDLR